MKAAAAVWPPLTNTSHSQYHPGQLKIDMKQWTDEQLGSDGGATNAAAIGAKVDAAVEAKRNKLAGKRAKLEVELPEDAPTRDVEARETGV